MRRKLILLIVGFFLFLQSKSSSFIVAEIPSDSARVVNVVWNPDDPYAFDENGIPSGFEIDLWRILQLVES